MTFSTGACGSLQSYLMVMKDNIDSASAVKNIILCECNFQPQSPSHKFCRLLQVLAAVQKLHLQNYLTEQQSVGGGRVLLR